MATRILETLKALTPWVLLVAALPTAQFSAVASKEQWIEGAKKEGEVILYASMNLEETNTMIARFEQKYPFVKVKVNRTDSEKLLTKILIEARAKKSFDDAIQTLGFAMHTLKKNQQLGHYLSAETATTARNTKKKGTGRRFIPTPTSLPTILVWLAERICRVDTKICFTLCGREK